VPRAAICYNFAPNAVFDYLAGVEVSSFKDAPAEFTQLSIPPQRYAVFPQSGREFSGGPSYERYDTSFDPKSGMGGMEIWLAVKN
jgi:AraC family transcriptional regulator